MRGYQGLCEDDEDNIGLFFKILNGKLFTSPVLFPRYVLALEKRCTAENKELLAWLTAHDVSTEEKHISEVSQAI